MVLTCFFLTCMLLVPVRKFALHPQSFKWTRVFSFLVLFIVTCSFP